MGERLSCCVLGDAFHIEQAQANGIDCLDVEALKAFNKDKKKVKKLANKYSFFLAWYHHEADSSSFGTYHAQAWQVPNIDREDRGHDGQDQRNQRHREVPAEESAHPRCCLRTC